MYVFSAPTYFLYFFNQVVHLTCFYLELTFMCCYILVDFPKELYEFSFNLQIKQHFYDVLSILPLRYCMYLHRDYLLLHIFRLFNRYSLCFGKYLPMPGGLQCSMHRFPPPVNYPSQYDPGC